MSAAVVIEYWTRKCSSIKPRPIKKMIVCAQSDKIDKQSHFESIERSK